MVDKILEGLAGLVDLLQVDAVLLTILLRVHVAVPAVFLQLWNRIDRGIEVGHFLRTQRAAQNNEAIEVEVVDFSVGWFHADQPNTTSRVWRVDSALGWPGSPRYRGLQNTDYLRASTNFSEFDSKITASFTWGLQGVTLCACAGLVPAKSMKMLSE